MTSGPLAAPARARRVEDPYVGLTYFTEEYVDYFFGRDAESSLIIGNLRAARLTLLYAQSGVGKSSVLRAGVVASLRSFAEREMSSRGSPRLVPVIFSSWSERPLAALIHAVGEAIRPYLGPERSAPELPEDDLEAALEAASEALDATLLVILDQFEEHFLYPEQGAEEDPVATQLAACVNRPDLRANFLISIREDSYAKLGDLFRGKLTNVYGNFLHMDFLDRAGGREAIERPIERHNESAPESEPFSVEPALVDAVLDQVGHDQAVGDQAAPTIETTFLQLVMRRLWEEEGEAGSRVLRLQTLEKLGGAQAIIGNHLDRAMASGADGSAGLSLAQQRIAAAAFRFLVTSGGTKIALTTADLADLTELQAAEIEPVLRHLSSPSLHILRPVVFEDGEGEPRYEIFHDALADPIVKWRTRIKEEEREARARQEREEKEEARRAAAAAEQRAQRERQRRRVAQALLALAVLALLGVAAYIALHQQSVSDQRQATNQSVQAAERIGELAHAPSFGPAAAALAGVEDYGLAPTTEARNQILAQLQRNPGLPRIFAGHTRAVEAVAFWPGSGNLASGGADNTLRLWDPAGHEIGDSPFIANAVVVRVAVSRPAADGTRIIAAGLKSGQVELWKVDAAGNVTPGSHQTLRTGSSAIWGLAFSPRIPDLLAVGGDDVTLWRLGRGRPRRPQDSRAIAGSVNGLAFSAGGGRLFVVTGVVDEEFRLTGAGSRFAAAKPARLGGGAVSVATGPHGSYALSSGDWIKVKEGARTQRMVTVGTINRLAFADGGRVLVSGSEDWNVTTWDVASGRPFGPPRSDDEGAIEDLAISSDGRTIAAAGQDGLVRLWPVRARHSLATVVGSITASEADGEYPTTYALSVNAGGRVASADGEAGTSIWSLRKPPRPGSAPQPVARIRGASYAVAYHQDLLVTGRRHSFAVYGTGPLCRGKGADPCLLAVPSRAYSEEAVYSLVLRQYGERLLLASAGTLEGKGVFNLWDLSAAANGGKIVHLRTSRRLDTEIRCLAFSPAYPLLAVGAADGKTRVWDVSDPSDPKGIDIKHARGNENQPVDAIAFSRDGSLLASGGEDQQVVLWTVEHGGSEVVLEGTAGTLLQGQSIFSLAFSRNGDTLAAGDGEGVVCLYDVATRREIGDSSCLLGHDAETIETGGINAVRFGWLGGKTVLLTAGAAQPIVAWSSILWNGSHSGPVANRVAADACALAHRNLTEDEWRSVLDSTALADARAATCPRYPLPPE